jgi:uncharacterized protein YoaH (UPF0181 family)
MFLKSRFEKVFGFKPTELSSLLLTEQERVNKHLTILASAYSAADKRERALIQRGDELISKGSDFGDALKLRAKQLRDQQRAVANAKEAFWKAQRLAKKEGYEVFPKYTDYLLSPDPIRSK